MSRITRAKRRCAGFAPSSQKRVSFSERAALIGHAPTESGDRLFGAMRSGGLGVTFGRRISFRGQLVAGLPASEVRLIFENDGRWHAAGEAKDVHWERARYTRLRVEAKGVMANAEAAVVRAAAEVVRLRGTSL